MAFMRPEVTGKQEWAEVETGAGTWYVPFDILSTNEAKSARHGDFEPLLQYTEGRQVYNDQSSIKKGYGVRLSAPGYMDSTSWEVYSSKKEALKRARQMAREAEGEDYATKKRTRHATKKSPTQLQREIDETLTGHSTKKRSVWPSVVGSHGLGTADVRTGQGAYWIVTRPKGYRVDYKPWGPSNEIDLGMFPSRRLAHEKIAKHALSLGATIR